MEGYRVVQKLGSGSYGFVYLCEREKHDEKIVLKEIKLDVNKNFMQSSKNEVDILRKLRHPNIVRFHRHFRRKDTFCILMEFAESGNLHDYISRQRTLGYIPEKTIYEIFCQILLGLDYIHSKNILHRDMKTENILLTGKLHKVVKIADFGISKILIGDHKTQTVIGTTNYLAPEICEEKLYDKKSDVWSIGCILYELCALERMFDGSIKQIVLSITSGTIKTIDLQIYSRSLQDLIRLMLTVPVADRPDTRRLIASPQLAPSLVALYVNLGHIHHIK